MKEIKAIINAYEQANAAGKRTALATVVHVEGSSYRRPGARMLVTDDGEMIGAISGGCLEGDALRKAQLVIAQQLPKLVIYDTRDDDDAFIGRQLGCAGMITVLFEPIDPLNPSNAIECLRKVNAKREAQLLVTLFSLSNKNGDHPGTCYWQQGDKLWSSLSDGMDIIHDIKQTFQYKASQFLDYKSVTAFFEYIRPAVSLVLVGAGNDVVPVASMAELLGWDVHVVDGRSTHAHEERFPSACQVLVGKPETLIEKITFDERTAVVLITHNYQYDLAMFNLLIDKPIPYIGVLGPAKKRERLFTDLGRSVPEDTKAIVFGPTGLDLGSETPEEIALSVIAEIQAVLQNRTPIHLREVSDVIHDRASSQIKSRS